jgi:hypothetical protein
MGMPAGSAGAPKSSRFRQGQGWPESGRSLPLQKESAAFEAAIGGWFGTNDELQMTVSRQHIPVMPPSSDVAVAHELALRRLLERHPGGAITLAHFWAFRSERSFRSLRQQPAGPFLMSSSYAATATRQNWWQFQSGRGNWAWPWAIRI